MFTANSRPGWSLNREKLISVEGTEYREWSPYRSKLAAYIVCGGTLFPFGSATRTLYLGAASGTTASHIADISVSGKVYCIEKAFAPYSRLLEVCSVHGNMVPVMADASHPLDYSVVVEEPEVLYQDIAQKDMVDIFLKNIRAFPALRFCFLVVKSRSIDSTARPASVFSDAMRRLEGELCCWPEMVDISVFEKDHAIVAFRLR